MGKICQQMSLSICFLIFYMYKFCNFTFSMVYVFYSIQATNSNFVGQRSPDISSSINVHHVSTRLQKSLAILSELWSYIHKCDHVDIIYCRASQYTCTLQLEEKCIYKMIVSFKVNKAINKQHVIHISLATESSRAYSLQL